MKRIAYIMIIALMMLEISACNVTKVGKVSDGGNIATTAPKGEGVEEEQPEQESETPKKKKQRKITLKNATEIMKVITEGITGRGEAEFIQEEDILENVVLGDYCYLNNAICVQAGSLYMYRFEIGDDGEITSYKKYQLKTSLKADGADKDNSETNVEKKDKGMENIDLEEWSELINDILKAVGKGEETIKLDKNNFTPACYSGLDSVINTDKLGNASFSAITTDISYKGYNSTNSDMLITTAEAWYEETGRKTDYLIEVKVTWGGRIYDYKIFEKTYDLAIE